MLRRLGVGVLVACFAVLAGLYWWDYQLRETGRDRIAARLAARMIIAHLEAHPGRWPRGWEDLADDFPRLSPVAEQFIPMAEIERRVIIDFQAEPAEVVAEARRLPRHRFRVVFLRSGKEPSRPGGSVVDERPADANDLIYRYLNNRQSPPPVGDAPPPSAKLIEATLPEADAPSTVTFDAGPY
jgi:hypothetical protein